MKTVVSGKMYPMDGDEKWIEWLRIRAVREGEKESSVVALGWLGLEQASNMEEGGGGECDLAIWVSSRSRDI